MPATSSLSPQEAGEIPQGKTPASSEDLYAFGRLRGKAMHLTHEWHRPDQVKTWSGHSTQTAFRRFLYKSTSGDAAGTLRLRNLDPWGWKINLSATAPQGYAETFTLDMIMD